MLLAGQFILFFKKYNCSGCIRAVLNSLFVSICPNGKSPGLVGAATVAACVAKDREAVGTLLCNAKYAGWEPEGMELASMDEDVAKGYDVRGYPFEVYAMLPPRFAFAITKTLTASNLTSSSRFDKKAEFYVLIEALSNKCRYQRCFAALTKQRRQLNFIEFDMVDHRDGGGGVMSRSGGQLGGESDSQGDCTCVRPAAPTGGVTEVSKAHCRCEPSFAGCFVQMCTL